MNFLNSQFCGLLFKKRLSLIWLWKQAGIRSVWLLYFWEENNEMKQTKKNNPTNKKARCFLGGYLTERWFKINICQLHLSVFTQQTQGAAETFVLHPPGRGKIDLKPCCWHLWLPRTIGNCHIDSVLHVFSYGILYNIKWCFICKHRRHQMNVSIFLLLIFFIGSKW